MQKWTDYQNKSKTLAKINSEGEYKFNQQLDLSVKNPEKGEAMTPCMDVHKEKNQSNLKYWQIEVENCGYRISEK